MTQVYPGQMPQAPQFPPQPFVQPGYPQQPQQFAPPVQMPPGYPQPTMAPPPQPLAQGSIDDFYNQPSGSGTFVKWTTPGDRLTGVVARAITAADIRQQTTPPNQGSQPQFYRDGRPKFEMIVPLRVAPSAEVPDGLLALPIRGQDRDELSRAMSEAGAPEGPPEPGALIDIVFTHLAPSRGGGSPRKAKTFSYVRPENVPAGLVAPGMQPAAPQQFAYAQPGTPQATFATGGVVQQPQVPAYGQVPQQPVPQAPAVPQPAPPVVQTATPAQPPVAPQQAPAAPAQPAPQPPADLSDDQQALLARLTGAGQQG